MRGVRANQWVISNQSLSARELDRAALGVMRHQAHCLFDLYHCRRNSDAMQALAPLTDSMGALIERSQSRRGGALVVIPHLSNYDLLFIANASRGLQAQLLTLAAPTGGYRSHNSIRAADGFSITPVSDEATRQAVQRLKDGGLVITGIDRPIEGKKRSLAFFGQPSFLPAGYIRMAMQAHVPVIAAAVSMSPGGQYGLTVSEPIPMQSGGRDTTAILETAETVLDVIAGFIRRAPQQWLMYYPLWPHLSASVPS